MNVRTLLIAVIGTGLLSFPAVQAQEQKPPANPPQASGGGAKPIEAAFRVVRAVSGTKALEEGGRFVVEDPRTIFYASADKQIIVHFTWEGPPGQHHFEGLWKNPAGKIVMTSDFDHTPTQPRFGVYFKMLLGELGGWQTRLKFTTALRPQV